MPVPTQEEISRFDEKWGNDIAPSTNIPAPQINPAHPPPSTPQVDPVAISRFQSKWANDLPADSNVDISGAVTQQRSGREMLLPQTSAAVDSLSRQNVVQIPQTPLNASGQFLGATDLARQDYQQAAGEPGVPLDTESGADALLRLKVGLHRNRTEQLDVLRKEVGEENVRLDPDGQFIIRTKDQETGKPKDVLLDEKNLTIKDALDIAHEYPAIAASLLTTKGVPVTKVWSAAWRAAAGYLAGGAAEDIAAREYAGEPVDPAEILSTRGPEAVNNALFGYGLGKTIAGVGMLSRLGKVASSSLADTTKAGAMADIEAARHATTARFGVEMKPTVAELTGNPMAVRLESFLSNIPIARNFILKKWAAQIENEKAIQSAMMGGAAPDAEAAGQKLIGLLEGEVKGAEGVVGKAADVVRNQSQTAITKPLSKISGKSLTSTEFGSSMTKRADTQLKAFKAEAAAKYDASKFMADGVTPSDATKPLFSSSDIKKEAKTIREEELVSQNKATEKAAYDQYGNTRSVINVSKAPIKELIPSGVDPILTAFDKLPATASYFDLVKLRSAIYDRIDSPEPISSNGTRLLKKLGKAVTEEMDKKASLLNPETVAKINDASKFYKENVETFYQKGIVDMLKPRTESGAVDPEAIATRLLKGGKGSVTSYQTIKDFFKNDPKAVMDMNRLFRDKILDSGTDQATGLIKLDDLAGAVSKMEPEIVQALFGQSKDKLMAGVQQGQLALRAGNAATGMPARGTQDAVESDALKKLMDAGKVDSYAINKLVMASNDLKAQYGNAIRQAVKQNDLGVIQASPETFVKDYLTNPSIKLADVKNVMQSVYRSGDDALIGDIRRATLSDVFAQSAKTAKGDVSQITGRIKGSPLRDLDPQKLSIKLEDPAVRARLEEILGHDAFTGLKDFATAIAGRSQRDIAGTLTGAFAGGSMFERILGGLGELTEVPKYLALSWLVTSPRIISMLRGAAKLSPMNLDKAVRSAILTPEFLHVLASDSHSPEEAKNAMEELKKLGTPK